MHSDEPSVFNDISEGNNYCTEYNCCPIRKDSGSDLDIFLLQDGIL